MESLKNPIVSRETYSKMSEEAVQRLSSLVRDRDLEVIHFLKNYIYLFNFFKHGDLYFTPLYEHRQCSGSVSVGSVNFWTSRIRIHLSNKQKHWFLQFYGFFITCYLWNVNGPTVGNMQKILIVCWHLESRWKQNSGMDPRIRICIKSYRSGSLITGQ